MSHPLITGTTILAQDYNETYNIIAEIIGPGENGYGFGYTLGFPVSSNDPIRLWQMQGLQGDVNTAYKHITNNYTGLQLISTTTTVGAALQNQLYDAAQYALANRYTCHPNQYFVDPDTGATINTTEGTSTRTLSWGLAPNNQIQHKVNVYWASRLTRRYFFNAGGKLEWTPGHNNQSMTGLPLNDLDAEWANFIEYWQATQDWTYDRNVFVTYNSTSTSWSSGTLQIIASADIESDENIRFTFTYRNNNTPTLVVVPSSGFWNYLV
jgi:hypothetical protein